MACEKARKQVRKNFSAFRPRVVNLSEKSAWKIEGKVCVCVREMSGRTEEDLFCVSFPLGSGGGGRNKLSSGGPQIFLTFLFPTTSSGKSLCVSGISSLNFCHRATSNLLCEDFE